MPCSPGVHFGVVRSDGGDPEVRRSLARGGSAAGGRMMVSSAEQAMDRVTARIGAWSQRERALAHCLVAGLALPNDPVGPLLHPGPLATVRTAVDAPAVTPVDHATSRFPAGETALVEDPWVRIVPQPLPMADPVFGPDLPSPGPGPAGILVEGRSRQPFEDPNPPQSFGPFDELVDAVRCVNRSARARTLPPAERFMVRVAAVQKPHRATKRNYDYFEELDAVLAANSEPDSGGGRGPGTPAP